MSSVLFCAGATPCHRSSVTQRHHTDVARPEFHRALANSGVVQPTVCILTGDVNLGKDVATAGVQPDRGERDLQEHLDTEASNAPLSGP